MPLRRVFHGVDHARYFREEGIVVVILVHLFSVVARAAHVQHRRIVRITQTQRISVREHVYLREKVAAMQRNHMHERAHRARLVLPRRTRHPRHTLLGGDAGLFVKGELAEPTRRLKVLEGVRNNRVELDFAAKVARQVTKVRRLLNHRAEALGLVPPPLLREVLVRNHVACIDGHHTQAVVRDDLLQLLRDSEVSKHVAHTHRAQLAVDVSIHVHDVVHGARRDGLLQEHTHAWKCVRQHLFDIASLVHTATERGRRADPDHMRPRVGRHRREVGVHIRVHGRVSVRAHRRRCALLPKHLFCILPHGVDQRHDVETRAELALKTDRVIPRTFWRAKVDLARTYDDQPHVCARTRRQPRRAHRRGRLSVSGHAVALRDKTSSSRFARDV